MRKILCIIALSIIFVFSLLNPAVAQVGRDGPGKTLEYGRLSGFFHVPQLQTNWCWGAIAAMVVNTMQGLELRACDIVSNAFGSNCCPAISACNSQNSVFAFDELLKPYGLRANVFEGRISWTDMINEIRNDRPVLVRVQSSLGEGHIISIVGFDESQKSDGRIRRSVVFSDPMYGFYIGEPDWMGYGITWEELQNGRLGEGYNAFWTHTGLISSITAGRTNSCNNDDDCSAWGDVTTSPMSRSQLPGHKTAPSSLSIVDYLVDNVFIESGVSTETEDGKGGRYLDRVLTLRNNGDRPLTIILNLEVFSGKCRKAPRKRKYVWSTTAEINIGARDMISKNVNVHMPRLGKKYCADYRVSSYKGSFN